MAYILNKAFISQLPHNEVKRIAFIFKSMRCVESCAIRFCRDDKIWREFEIRTWKKVIGALRSKGIS